MTSVLNYNGLQYKVDIISLTPTRSYQNNDYFDIL